MPRRPTETRAVTPVPLESSMPPLPTFIVYILESLGPSEHFCVGTTEDLPTRLRDHNDGKSPHTAKHRPWRVKSYVAFSDQGRALAFERYLKTGSGRAFAKKRL